ncbi:type II toxin-antitoxin system Phd/YefM family antitoxin [Vallitalea pronyensis]|uniref:Type II toxin-antitoxin system Phd/YefM family antitoxin n=1 Tax=Vallitalea pronyensis TaxID=1348613 RepID=A0A8J8MMS8_9FIRM|nr:type II toxin-antitoxin system Phd/YefM family antitoxin [Vallitalea pronyensis]QUI24555.1 type II toxin-antitoxin system Phd/YefM family antitoxin [Vallitalea pronyensis]
MKVNSTEIKNNFGKYLRLSAKEDIIITKNGSDVAKLIAYDDNIQHDVIKEAEPAYSTSGTKISYEDFLKISENSDDRFEYIDGEIYLLASPKVTHQNVLMELVGLFYNFFNGKPCQPAFAPFDITLKRNAENINIVQPDLMIICDLEEHLNDRDYYMGVPTLAVEIISQSSRKKDYIKKLDLYMDCGVKEYWIVNPFNQEITIFSFTNKTITANRTFNLSEEAVSYHFEDLKVNMQQVFQN